MMMSLRSLLNAENVSEPALAKYHSAVRSTLVDVIGLSIGLPSLVPVRLVPSKRTAVVLPDASRVTVCRCWALSVVCTWSWLKSGRDIDLATAKRNCSSLLAFMRRFRLGNQLPYELLNDCACA